MGYILIVDDEAQNRTLMERYLSKLGYEYKSTDNGSRVMDIIKQHRPLLILLDLIMPEFDGIDTVKTIRNEPEYYDLPIIMISATKDKDKIMQALLLGATDFVSKPMELEALSSKIKKMVE